MTDIEKMIEEAAKSANDYAFDPPEEWGAEEIQLAQDSAKADVKRALSTIAPLEDLAGVKAGTHRITPINGRETRLKEYVLEALQSDEGLEGLRATEIREYIQSHHNEKHHIKTIWASLYRLRISGLAYDRSKLWFVSRPEAGGTGNG